MMNQWDETRRRPRGRHLVATCLGVSLLLHLQAILVAVAVLSMNPDGCRVAPDLPIAPFEVALVDPSEADRKAQEIKEELEREDKRVEEEDRRATGQVVEIPRPVEEKRPKEAEYLSEYDSTVTRQTKAPPSPKSPGRRALAMTSPGRPAPRAPEPPSPEPRKDEPPKPRERQPTKLAMRSPARRATEQPSPPARLSPSEDGKEARQEEPAAAEKRQSAQRRDLPTLPPPGSLRLSDKELAEAVGGLVNDALQDVDDGDETLLNSKRWRFASFFNRVKRQVAQNWHPDRAYRRRDPSGNVYGFKDRLTILRVRLSPRGELEDMHVEQPSGLGFLDDEALNAFRLAEPFPNPPRGLVDEKTGKISFRFGFLFELSRRSNFRILRFSN